MAKGKLLMASLTVAALTACSGGSGVGNEGRELSSEADRSKSMTMTGCLQAGDPAGTYVLRTTSESAGDRARRDDRGLGSGEEAIGTGGSGGTGGSSAGGRDAMMSTPAGTFRLIPGAGENLGQYLGQQVRVKGQIADDYTDRFQETETPESARRRSQGEGDVGRGVKSEPNRGSGGGRIQPGPADQSTNAQFFRVTEIDKVADRCAGGTADKDRK
ncbi:MAG: hypothetical protein EHM24_23635 [Acidobacteria bacterium]|nr:MAG: hypothetical protein EHM24_23635 [Acidobacteriota bacterium]